MSLQDLNKQYSGVTAVTSGPLIIRTYNDQSGNNTYLLTTYEYPVSSNYVMITSSGGQVVPTDNIYVSSICASTISINKGFFSTLTGLTETVSTISSNTVSVTSSIITSSITAINSYNNFVTNTSTIVGSTIQSNRIYTNTVSTYAMNAVSTTISSIVTSSIVGFPGSGTSIYPSLTTLTISTSTFSTSMSYSLFLTNACTITGSTIACSTVNAGAITYSTLIGSSITTTAINASTIQTSTLATQFINYSTLIGSTISTNTLVALSSIRASTLTNPTQLGIVVSTVTLVTFLTTGIQYGASYAPSFCAYNSPTTVGTTITKISWSNTEWNTGNAFTTGVGSSAFICPATAPGVYSIHAGISPATTSTSISLYAYKNGTAYKSLAINYITAQSSSPLNCIVRLLSGDTVEIYCAFGVSQAVNNLSYAPNSGLYSYFQMCWLRS